MAGQEARGCSGAGCSGQADVRRLCRGACSPAPRRACRGRSKARRGRGAGKQKLCALPLFSKLFAWRRGKRGWRCLCLRCGVRSAQHTAVCGAVCRRWWRVAVVCVVCGSAKPGGDKRQKRFVSQLTNPRKPRAQQHGRPRKGGGASCVRNAHIMAHSCCAARTRRWQDEEVAEGFVCRFLKRPLRTRDKQDTQCARSRRHLIRNEGGRCCRRGQGAHEKRGQRAGTRARART